MALAALLASAGCDSEIVEDRLAIVNINPSPGAIDIGTGTDIQITFSEILRAETVNASTICVVRQDATFSDCNGAVIPVQTSYNPTRLAVRLVPVIPFDASTDYVIRVTTGARGDRSGPLPAPVESGFRTY